MVDARIAETRCFLHFGMGIENGAPGAVVPHFMTNNHHAHRLPIAMLAHLGDRASKAVAISELGQHRRSRHPFTNTIESACVTVRRDEDDCRAADLTKPPRGLDPLPPPSRQTSIKTTSGWS